MVPSSRGRFCTRLTSKPSTSVRVHVGWWEQLANDVHSWACRLPMFPQRRSNRVGNETLNGVSSWSSEPGVCKSDLIAPDLQEGLEMYIGREDWVGHSICATTGESLAILGVAVLRPPMFLPITPHCSVINSSIPQVNGTVPQFVLGTFGGRMHIVYASPRRGILVAGLAARVNTSGHVAIEKQREQEVGYDYKTSGPGPARWLRSKGTCTQVQWPDFRPGFHNPTQRWKGRLFPKAHCGTA